MGWYGIGAGRHSSLCTLKELISIAILSRSQTSMPYNLLDCICATPKDSRNHQDGFDEHRTNMLFAQHRIAWHSSVFSITP